MVTVCLFDCELTARLQGSSIKEFDGKSVIVTGGAKGIGRAITLAFAREGARVYLADVDGVAGSRTVAEAAALPGTVTLVKVDVSVNADCRRLVETVVADTGGLDILCNNAGIQPPASYVPAHDLPEDIWNRVLDVNLKGTFLMVHHCIAALRARGGGVIVNIASVHALQGARNAPAYAASKGGQLALTRQLAVEYAADGIRVLAVCPGVIGTPMIDDMASRLGVDTERLYRDIAKRHPLGRVGAPEDVAAAVLFLAGAGASFMTGEYVCRCRAVGEGIMGELIRIVRPA